MLSNIYLDFVKKKDSNFEFVALIFCGILSESITTKRVISLLRHCNLNYQLLVKHLLWDSNY